VPGQLREGFAFPVHPRRRHGLIGDIRHGKTPTRHDLIRDRQSISFATNKSFHFAEKLADIPEAAVNGRETDIGHFIQFFQVIHNFLPDYRPRHLTLKFSLNFGDDRIDQDIDLLRADGPLLAGPFDAGFQLVSIQFLMPAVPLYDL
jgi:hypothetical protein